MRNHKKEYVYTLNISLKNKTQMYIHSPIFWCRYKPRISYSSSASSYTFNGSSTITIFNLKKNKFLFHWVVVRIKWNNTLEIVSDSNEYIIKLIFSLGVQTLCLQKITAILIHLIFSVTLWGRLVLMVPFPK